MQGRPLANNLVAGQGGDYAALKDIDAVGGDWDDLKNAANPPIDPQRNEELLKVEHVLEAVRKIGPQFAQEFYRGLAGSRERDARIEAARRLAEIGPDATSEADRAKNLPLLRALLGDTDGEVRQSAAVSLIIVGQNDGREIILEGLKGRWPMLTLLELDRVGTGKLPGFTREVLLALTKYNADTEYSNEQIRKSAKNLLSKIAP